MENNFSYLPKLTCLLSQAPPEVKADYFALPCSRNRRKPEGYRLVKL